MEKKFVFSRILILLLVIFMPFNLMYGQKIDVSGKVTDETGQAIPGVNVLVKGSTEGTITDLNGNYAINTDKNATLIFSFLGYKTVEIPVNNQSNISISLKEEDKSIDEVVVVGYGTAKKSHLTGSVSKVKNENLSQIPVARMDEALIGQVSGTTIQMTDASAGGTPTIRIRGIGSITADASPLVVLDGMVVSNDYLNSINMDDVASIEVLKDAASAAIYGSRGGNGIIMITSKKGKRGKTSMSFNSFVGYKTTPNIQVMPTVAEWSEFVKENNGGNLTDKMEYINKIGTNTDWHDVMFDGGFIQNYSLSARGGSENTSFSISGSYLNDAGVLLTDNYKKYNLNVYVKSKITDFLEFGIRANPSYTTKRDFPIGIHDALRQSPWLPLFHDENTIQYVDRNNYPDVQIGDYTKERQFDNYDLYENGSNVDISTTSNVSPLAKVLEREYYKYDFKTYGNAYLKVKILKGLNFRTNLGVSFRKKDTQRWVGSKAHRNGLSAIESIYNTSKLTHIINENLLTYNKVFGKHDINAVAGVTFEAWDNYYSDQTGKGYQFDYIHTLNAASIKERSDTYSNQERLNSILGRVSYAYAGKYLFSLSLRYDGSSKFGTNNRYGFFPAGSVGWRVTEEKFMENIPVISNLKLRFSYGVTGTNQGIGYYQHMAILEPTTAVIGGNAVTGFNPANIPNPDLGWEQSVEMDPGLDLGLFNNRLNLSLDLYRRSSLSLLLEQEISSVTGFNTALVNIGEVQNSGIEIELGGQIIAQTQFKWSASGNLSMNKNELVDFAGASGLITYVDSKRPAEYIALEGYPISSFYGYVYDKDIPLQNLKDPYFPIGGKSQDVYVKDLNGDGIIDSDDRAILGSPYPKLVWAINNQFLFKGFDLNFMFQGSYGAKIRNMDPQYFQNQFNSRMDYISDVNDPNYFPDGDKVKQRFLTDLFVQDASYITLRNLNIGYSFSKSILSRIGFSKLRIYAAAQNLLYIMSKDYTSFNPEGVTYTKNPLQAGYQRGAAPIYKTISFGINLDF